MWHQYREELDKWYRSPRGEVFAAALQQQLSPWVQEIFGYHAIQYGNFPPERWLLESSRINHLLLADSGVQAHCRCLADAMPFDANSTDLIIIAHTLEYSADPHAVLREAERVLVSNGHLLIVGVHPWTLRSNWQRLRGKHGQLYTPGRVSDWLNLLSFDLKSTKQLPMIESHLSGRLGQMPLAQKTVRFLSSGVAGGYAILAQKRVTRVKPITPSWRRRPKLIAGGLAGTTAASRVKRVKDD